MDSDTFSNDNVCIPASLFFNYDIKSSTTDNDKETIGNHSNKKKVMRSISLKMKQFQIITLL